MHENEFKIISCWQKVPAILQKIELKIFLILSQLYNIIFFPYIITSNYNVIITCFIFLYYLAHTVYNLYLILPSMKLIKLFTNYLQQFFFVFDKWMGFMAKQVICYSVYCMGIFCFAPTTRLYIVGMAFLSNLI